jgi:hypothetical protein
MRKSIKKVSSVLLSATTVIWLSGATVLVPTALAQSVSIESLLQQIAALQAQLTALQVASSGSVQASACVFTRNLTVGMKGDDVKCLQTSLSVSPTSGYFGPLTKKAVAAWQATNGVSPAVGYFGSLSRAKYSSVAGAPGVPGVVLPASGLAVTLAADSPMGSAIAGAGQVDVAKWVLTASSGAGVTVSDLKLQRMGVVSDSNISNLYLADESGIIFAQYSSLNNGVAWFNALNLQVNAGQSRVVTLRMDLGSGATAGNTLGWRLDEVKAGSSVVASPMVAGKDLTVTTVANPALAAVTYTYTATGGTVDAGTNGFLAHAANLAVTNSAVLLKSLKLTVVGSANKADIKNAKLRLGGVEVASAAVLSGDVVTFIPATGTRLATGNSTLEVFVDVMGSPNRTMAWNVLRPYDAVFTDTQYNANLTPSTSGSATSVTINQGRVTISKATDSPTANVPAGASNVTLGKFNFYAGGEPVKVRFLPVTLLNVGDNAGAVNTDLRNIAVIDDVGNSVGTTNSSPTGVWGADGTCGSADVTGTVAANSCDIVFGSSSSYINYVIPANTTRVLSVKADIVSTTNLTSVRASLGAPASANLEGQISFQTSTAGTATGNTLTVTLTPLTVGINGAFANPSYVAGANNVKVASFVLTASSAEAVKVSTLTLRKQTNADFDAQSLKVMVGSTQFGTTQAIVADTDAAMTFSGSSPLLVPAGGSVIVDVYADILTSTGQASPHATVFDLSSGSGVGATSNSSFTWPAAVDGQGVTITGAPTITSATDSDNVSARYLVMGSTDNVIYKLRFSVDNTEDTRVTDIVFRDTITGNTAGRASLSNLKLYDSDGTLLAGPVSLVLGSDNLTTGTVTFALGSASSLVVPKNTSKTVTVKADIASFTAGAVSNSGHTLSVSATGDVTAFGKDSSTTATRSGTPAGTAQTVYRSKPSLTATLLGAASGRTRVAVDEVANLNFAANAADDLILLSVTVRLTGAAVSGAANFTADLIDAGTNASWGTSAQVTCSSAAAASCTAAFTGASSPNFTITRGTTKVVKLRINSANFVNAANTSDSLSAIIDINTGLKWNDRTTDNINWEAFQIPITLVNVSYE